MGAYRSTAVNLRTGPSSASNAETERASAAAATASTFRVLRTRTLRGRGFTDDDERPGAPPVLLIGEGLWQRDFGGDPSVVGRRVSVDGMEREIVGVMPARTSGFPPPRPRSGYRWRSTRRGRSRPRSTIAASHGSAPASRSRRQPRISTPASDSSRSSFPDASPRLDHGDAHAAARAAASRRDRRQRGARALDRARRRGGVAARRLRQRREPVSRPRRGPAA